MPMDDDAARESEGEVVPLEGLEGMEDDVEDTDDGGAIVKMEDSSAAIEETKRFYRNLLDDLDPSETAEIGAHLVDMSDKDKSARSARDDLYEEGIKRTGLGDEAPGGATFRGASRTVHPMLAKACVDFGARAIKEIMPSSDIVRPFIPGEVTRPRLEKAKRKTAYMNWQFKTQMPEFRSELEQVLTQLPLAGSQYLYLIYDRDKGRPVPQFWPIDDVVIPFAATNFYTSERTTMIERITEFEFKRRVSNGQYADIGVASVAFSEPERTRAGEASDRIEGREQSGENEDGMREIRRIFTYLEIEDDEVLAREAEPKRKSSAGKLRYAPYVVEVEAGTRRALSIVRNWEKSDKRMQPMHWLIDFTFLYWRGAVGVGLTHLIGSLSGTATGAMRALLDSAHVNNMPTAVRLKGANVSGQSVELNACSITEIEGSLGSTDPDIRKLIMAIPFNPPSPVLYQLLAFVTEQGEGVVRTTFDGLLESAQQNMPVGTMLAMVEQGMKVLGAIHLRLYDSMSRTLGVLERINRMYIDEEDILDEAGVLIAKRSDFQGPLDVIPVADPETFSDAQRFAQIQMVAQRAITMPQLYDLRKVEELILERTNIPEAKELLIPAPKPMEMNAVNENAAAAFGRPISAFPEQEHLSHIQAHCDFIMSPFLGACMLIAPRALPTLLNHLGEHLVLWYVAHTVEIASGAMGVDISTTMNHKDPETRAELDKTLAVASNQAVKHAAQAFSKVLPVIQAAQQVLQQLGPQPGSMVDAKITVQQMKSQDAQQKLAAEQQMAQADQQAEQQNKVADINAQREARAQKTADGERKQGMNAMTAQQRDAASMERTTAGNDSRERINTADNETALRIAAAEIASGERVEVKSGGGINPGSE